MHPEGDIYYLRQKVTDLPDEDDWLSSGERSTLGTFQVPKRRSDWRLGRWTAKCAVSAYLGWSRERLRDIEVLSLASGAPEIIVPGLTHAPEISISHSCDVCICVVGNPSAWIGCDLETLEVRSQAFIQTFFTPEEVAVLTSVPARERTTLANVIWSAKESYLKSTREGLRRDTKDVETIGAGTSDGNIVSAKWAGWLPMWITDQRRRSVVYWRLGRGFVETVCRKRAPIVSVIDVSPPDC